MVRILTLTGVSGAGKTTLARLLIERVGGTSIVTSYTTRKARASDVPGEYNHVSSRTHDAMALRGEFLWTAAHGSVRYGTKAADIDIALGKPEGLGIMILVPSAMQALREYLTARGALQAHVPIYIIVPDEDVLMRRLARRGDARKEVEKRLSEARSWKEAAVASDIPYAFVRNDGPVEAAYEQVLWSLI
ncbi:MAG: AAA family ATPase [bacterium]|nr:AAA family ATPase [bacterium]